MLLTVDQAIAALGLPVGLTDQLEGPVKAAIAKAQFLLEEKLDTSLDAKNTTDDFYTDLDHFCGITPAGYIHLRLTNAFVGTVALSESPSSLFGDYEVIPTDSYRVNPESGIVLLNSLYEGRYIKATYTSGFADATAITEAIRQALYSYLPLGMEGTQQQVPGEEATAKATYHVGGVVSARLNRPSGFHFRPISSYAT